jgi:hypothetical protein
MERPRTQRTVPAPKPERGVKSELTIEDPGSPAATRPAWYGLPPASRKPDYIIINNSLLTGNNANHPTGRIKRNYSSTYDDRTDTRPQLVVTKTPLFSVPEIPRHLTKLTSPDSARRRGTAWLSLYRRRSISKPITVYNAWHTRYCNIRARSKLTSTTECSDPLFHGWLEHADDLLSPLYCMFIYASYQNRGMDYL